MPEQTEPLSINNECDDVIYKDKSTAQRPVAFVIICLYLLVILLSGIILGETKLSPDPLLPAASPAPIEVSDPDIQGIT